MGSTTPRLALPYPVPADSVDVPRDVKALADRLDIITGAASGTALTSAPVLDVGMTGQVRAGRQLTLADFTSLGLSAPAGLWNLSNLTDASGNGRALQNKGAVPFGVGVNGLASTAAVFAGSTGQALYIADTGAADPFRILTGSWGCWFRSAKRGTAQYALSRLNNSGNDRAFALWVTTANVMECDVALITGASWSGGATGVSDVADDRWHFAVGAFDGTAVRLYVDGVLEATGSVAGALYAAPAPLNVGGFGADASFGTVLPHYGRVDEAFVTADVLSDDQVRALYCARIPHGYATTPIRVNLNVTRRRRGGAFATTDFPSQPLRLHNFTAGALTDQGSNGVTLANAGTAPINVAGADGTINGAFSVGATATAHLMATDAGLPAGTASRSYGCWFKTTTASGALVFISWGNKSSTASVFVWVNNGALNANNGADSIVGPYVADGQWHFVTLVEDNAAGDGVRRKLYLDGRLVGGSTVLNTITLLGANGYRLGADQGGINVYTGQIDGAFVSGVALTFEQQAALYAKGTQAMLPSPKNAGDHVESMDATNVIATFDTLDSTALVDMGVEA